MATSKSIVEYSGRRITYETPLKFAEVATRFETALNKSAGGPAVFRVLGTAQTKEELETGINALTAGGDFLYFGELAHHRWMKTYTGVPTTPQTAVYTFGNPLIAQTMLSHDYAAGLHIPLRLMLLENVDEGGTKVIYDDPAPLVFLPGGNDELRKAAQVLSAKVERFVQAVIEQKTK
ncbi:TT1751-like protein [Trametes versicolor FP-101664 SS1]|uniref:TT1751-like protein n=1 Tax=Trametes versicolor (strain FP-101664) TaxID=717944 RepID=UPI0004622EB5|nr:TT1751-like protein [Trametes versicolor FP-101664 SS1]EIW53261.1 TT1751-like protein [Trametes versicolor FP-101664 SS1]